MGSNSNGNFWGRGGAHGTLAKSKPTKGKKQTKQDNEGHYTKIDNAQI